MRFLYLRTGLTVGVFLFFYSSCNNTNQTDANASAGSAVSSRSDTMMPPESTTVAATPHNMPSLHGKEATKDSPGVKVDVHTGTFKLRDTTEKTK